MRIHFENEFFVAVDKPAGWLSVPSRAPKTDPRPCVASELSKQYSFIVPVHRIDDPVSGLLLLAKSPDAHRAACGWFESHEIEKTYEAWSSSPAASAPGLETEVEWRSTLLRGKKRAYRSEHGKLAITRARRFETLEALVLAGREKLAIQKWRLEPKTGRSHQLRFEMAAHGFPILGDALYGSSFRFKDGGIALRALKLDFNRCRGRERFDLPKALETRPLELGVLESLEPGKDAP